MTISVDDFLASDSAFNCVSNWLMVFICSVPKRISHSHHRGNVAAFVRYLLHFYNEPVNIFLLFFSVALIIHHFLFFFESTHPDAALQVSDWPEFHALTVRNFLKQR